MRGRRAVRHVGDSVVAAHGEACGGSFLEIGQHFERGSAGPEHEHPALRRVQEEHGPRHGHRHVDGPHGSEAAQHLAAGERAARDELQFVQRGHQAVRLSACDPQGAVCRVDVERYQAEEPRGRGPREVDRR